MLEMYQMLEISENIKKMNYTKIVSQNLRKYRLEFFNKYKMLHKNIDNPYSSENIAHILNISRRHYSRLENPNYINKNITIDKLLVLSRIYGITLESLCYSEQEGKVLVES